MKCGFILIGLGFCGAGFFALVLLLGEQQMGHILSVDSLYTFLALIGAGALVFLFGIFLAVFGRLQNIEQVLDKQTEQLERLADRDDD